MFLQIMKRHMAQGHMVIKFFEHRVTFAIIYVKFDNHKIIISYSLWKGHAEMKISPWKKTFADIFGVERHTFQISHDQREHNYTCVEQRLWLGVLVCASYLRCFNYTRLKCTQSTLHIGCFNCIFIKYPAVNIV